MRAAPLAVLVAALSVVAVSAGEPAAPPRSHAMVGASYDVVVVGSTASGIAAAVAAKRADPDLRVLLVSCAGPAHFDDMRANGLGCEDIRNASRLRTGIAAEHTCLASRYMVGHHLLPEDRDYRRQMLAWARYRPGGPQPNAPGRYTPEAAAHADAVLLRGAPAGRSGPIRIAGGYRVAAAVRDGSGVQAVVLEGQDRRIVTARCFIDATPTADLARRAGAGYRLGSTDALYNDATALPPEPVAFDDYATATQALSPLLTVRRLAVSPKGAPALARSHPYYRLSGAAGQWPAFRRAADALRRQGKLPGWRHTFAGSWGEMGGGFAEFNEKAHAVGSVLVSTDHIAPLDVYGYILHEELRPSITRRAFANSLNLLRYYQEVLRAPVALAPAHYPGRERRVVYLREGPRVEGIGYRAVQGLPPSGASPAAWKAALEAPAEDSIGLFSFPADAHFGWLDHAGRPCGGFWLAPRETRSGPPLVEIPYSSLLPRGFGNLLVSEAVSVDRYFYAVLRMETAKSLMGQAAGTAAALSLDLGTTAPGLPVLILQEALEGQGVRLFRQRR